MARGTKPAVSNYERRRWLDELENGKGITEISKSAGRDIRVVKRHIEIARDERYVANAKRDFLVGRMQQHQSDLLTEVQRLRRLIIQDPPVQLIPDDLMERKLHDALKEHARRLPLKRLLELHQSAVAEFEKDRDIVSAKLNEREAELVSSLPGGLVTFPWTPTLLEALKSGMPLGESSSWAYALEKQGEGLDDISWGSFHLMRSAVSEAKVPIIIDTHKKLISFAESHRPMFQQHRGRLRELSDQVMDELDVYIIKRYVPGRCRYCPF